MSDALVLLGLAAIVAAFFLLAVIAGLFALGAALMFIGLALADGKGFTWRS